jgi:hypothetical protein
MKIRNIVWLTVGEQANLESTSAPLQNVIAHNEYIAQALKLVMSSSELQAELIKRVGEEKGVNLASLTEKVVEKVVEKKMVSLGCPFCPEDFTGKGAKYLREHILSKHVGKGVK